MLLTCRQDEVTSEVCMVTEASIEHAEETVNQVLSLSSQMEHLEKIKKSLNKLEQNLYYYEKVASSLLKRRKKTRERQKR